MPVVNGNWSVWSAWTPCDATCGTGSRSKFRICDNPPPENNGKFCEGEFEEKGDCKLTDCPGKKLFIMVFVLMIF